MSHPVDVDAIREVATARPVFIVGNWRSGTTLVSMVLSSHSSLDVGNEVGLALDLALAHRDGKAAAAGVALTSSGDTAELLGLPSERIREVLEELDPEDCIEVARLTFALRASTRGKARFGDKMPRYSFHVPELAAVYPDAQFVHVVRDGRDVSASYASKPWGDYPLPAAAVIWRSTVRKVRRHGEVLGPDRYCELRLEDFVAAPEEQARRLCAFLGEEFEPGMLDYSAQAKAVPEKDRAIHPHLTKPPTAGLRDWKRGVSPREVRAVEAMLRSTLNSFGYSTGPKRRTDLLFVWLGALSALSSLARRHRGPAVKYLLRRLSLLRRYTGAPTG